MAKPKTDSRKEHLGKVSGTKAVCDCGWRCALKRFTYQAIESLLDHYRQAGRLIETDPDMDEVSFA